MLVGDNFCCCCTGYSSCKERSQGAQHRHMTLGRSKGASSDSQSPNPKPTAHMAIQPQDVESAAGQSDRAGEQKRRTLPHSKRHKPNKQDAHQQTGAETAAKVQAKATRIVGEFAAPEPDLAQTGTLALAEKRQKDYNNHMQAKPCADTGGSVFDRRTGAALLTGHESKDSAFKDSAEARRLPGWQASYDSELHQDKQSPQQQLHSNVHDDSAAARPQTRGESGDTQTANDQKSANGHEQAQQSEAQSSQPSHCSSGMFDEIAECNQHAESKETQSPDAGHGGQAARLSEDVQDRLYDEQTQQHHPQNNSEEAKRCPFHLNTLVHLSMSLFQNTGSTQSCIMYTCTTHTRPETGHEHATFEEACLL